MRVALACGCESPTSLATRLSIEDFVLWSRYYDAEPWGAFRDDLRAAANTFLQCGSFGPTDEAPSLIFPYFRSENDLAERIAKHKEASKRALEEIEKRG
jgi:hypothetical protein